jgi:hypothetical protein
MKNMPLQQNDWAAVSAQCIFEQVCMKDTVLKIYFLYYNMETISNKCCRFKYYNIKKMAQNTSLHTNNVNIQE